MKKTLGHLFLVLNFVGVLPGTTFSQGISFEHDSTLVAIKAKARAANKPVFIDCYTTWCGPCKWMAKNIFPNDTVGKFFNENFVSLKMDMEKGDGIKVAAKYKISFYPTFLFLDTAGKELHRVTGTSKTNEFIAHAQKSLDPKNRFSSLKEQYQKGDRNPAFLRKYIMAAQQAGDMNVNELSDWYFAFIPENELVTKENFEIIERTVYQTSQPGFEKMYTHREKFTALVGKEKMDAKMAHVMGRSFNEAYKWDSKKQAETVNEEKYAAMTAKVKSFDFAGRDKILSEQEMRYLLAKDDQEAYLAALRTHIPKYSWNDAEELNNRAWKFYERSDKKAELELALSWSKRSLELSDDCYKNDTYAALCQKLNRKKEAMTHAQKALDQAKKAGENLTDYEARIAEIKKM